MLVGGAGGGGARARISPEAVLEEKGTGFGKVKAGKLALHLKCNSKIVVSPWGNRLEAKITQVRDDRLETRSLSDEVRGLWAKNTTLTNVFPPFPSPAEV